MRYPDFIQKKDTIGFVAPSFGCATEPYYSAFQNALRRFSKMGYKIQLGPNCYEAKGIGISNTPEACANELTEFYCSDGNQILLSCGGGELMCEILPYVDFDKISKAPAKWYMGYSDNTNFTFLNATLCDTASIYGPNAGGFGMSRWHPSLRDTWNLLEGKDTLVHSYPKWQKESKKDKEHPLAPYHCTEPTVIHKCNADETCTFSGRLLGGCMDSLINLLGTEFDHVKEFGERYQEDGIIWFLEACDLNVLGIRRALWQMKHAGWFRQAKGFLIGRPYCYGEEIFGLDQYQAVTDILAEFGVPVLMDLDIGHIPPIMPIVTGATADVVCNGNDLQICYTWK